MRTLCGTILAAIEGHQSLQSHEVRSEIIKK